MAKSKSKKPFDKTRPSYKKLKCSTPGCDVIEKVAMDTENVICHICTPKKNRNIY